MRYVLRRVLAVAFLVGSGSSSTSRGGERTQSFDQDPGWEGRNNRSSHIPPRTVRQNFGFSPDTRHAGGRMVGELGGVITPAAEPAFYAKQLSLHTLRDPLMASGKLACGEGGVHALVGFFNAATVNEWRTPNTIVIRIQGRGDRFFAYVEGWDTPDGRFPNYRDRPKKYLYDYLKGANDAALARPELIAEMRAEFDRMLEFVGQHFERGFRKTSTAKTVPRVRFEAIAAGTAIALRERPALNITVQQITALMEAKNFDKTVVSDGANVRSKLEGRIELVRSILVGE